MRLKIYLFCVVINRLTSIKLKVDEEIELLRGFFVIVSCIVFGGVHYFCFVFTFSSISYFYIWLDVSVGSSCSENSSHYFGKFCNAPSSAAYVRHLPATT